MLTIGTNGQNDTGIFGTELERFIGISFLAADTSGIGDFRQLRLGGIAGPGGGGLPPPSVPEPSTWALMLLGFGATGFAMRRSRKVPESRVRFR